MIKSLILLFKSLILLFKPLIDILDPLWLDIVRDAQREYNKPIRLNPNDGSDWRRELL